MDRQARNGSLSLEVVHRQWVATLDAIRDAIVVVDDRSFIVRANRVFARLAGLDVENLADNRIEDVLPWLIMDGPEISNVAQTSPNGQVFQVRSSNTIPELDGKVYILEDVTPQNALALAEERYYSDTSVPLLETIETLSRAQETTDPYTVSHNCNVADIAKSVALEMKLGEGPAQGVYLGALVHDIGKLGVPSSILNKPGRLAQAEMNLIRMHPETGFSIVKDLVFPWPVHEIILQHHERLDGSGYPRGLKGEEISLAAQIVAVADVAEAMSSHRPYRPALGVDAALAEIRKGCGTLYNSEAVKACCKVVETEDCSPGKWGAKRS